MAILSGAAVDLPHRVSKLATALGDLSYPLYAIHFPLIILAIFITGDRAVSAPFYWQLWLPFCAAVLIVAWIIDQVVEKPFQKWWRNRLSRASSREWLPPR